MGMSPLPPQARAAKVGVAEYRIYQMPVDGRKTAMSVLILNESLFWKRG
jgi:hypothetical protein